MLKLTYVETDFYLEPLAQSLEEWVALRVIFALRVGDPIYVEPSTAAFLLPADLPELNLLADRVRQQGTDEIELCTCDAEYVEVTLLGTWLSTDAQSANGVFVAALSDSTECLLVKLWYSAQVGASVLSD